LFNFLWKTIANSVDLTQFQKLMI